MPFTSISLIKFLRTLYLSVDDALLCEPLDNIAGVQLQYRKCMTSPVFAEIDTERIPLQGKYHCTYKEFGCNVILKDDDNAPVLTEYKYGKGTVYFCAYPIEDYAASVPGSCCGEEAIPYEKIYSMMKKLRSDKKKIVCDNPYVGITEHLSDDGTINAVLVNYRPYEQALKLSSDTMKIEKVIGDAQAADDLLKISANSGAVVTFGKIV